MRRFSGCGLCAVLLLVAAQLVGCANTTVRNPDTAGSGSGVTVYGTVDAGVGRTNSR